MKKDLIIHNEEKDGNLIPVHIGIARTEDFYWNWDRANKVWTRGEKISHHMKRMYANPLPPGKSAYE